MNRQSVIRTRLLAVLLVLALCASMTVPALAYEETTLYSGCRGEAVRVLQQALIDLGCLQGSADGIFGVRTEEAVRAFQLRSGLTPDGLAGTKTRTVLASARAGRVPAAAPACTAAAAARRSASCSSSSSTSAISGVQRTAPTAPKPRKPSGPSSTATA